MNHLDDKTALITGGGRGIGRAIALQLTQRGARVAVAARSEDELVETTSAMAASGGRAHDIVADLAAPGAGTALAPRVLDELGRVDIPISNAAVVAPMGASTGVDLEAFARAFTVNVTSVAELTFALVPAMVERRWGRVVNASSGIVAAPAFMVGANAYAATKAAIEAHTVTADVAGTGVTVNANWPGSVDTAMQAWVRDHDSDDIGRTLRDRFTERHGAGDLITREASAAAAALISALGSLNGFNLVNCDMAAGAARDGLFPRTLRGRVRGRPVQHDPRHRTERLRRGDFDRHPGLRGHSKDEPEQAQWCPALRLDLSAVDYAILVVYSPERLVGAPGGTGRGNGEHLKGSKDG